MSGILFFIFASCHPLNTTYTESYLILRYNIAMLKLEVCMSFNTCVSSCAWKSSWNQSQWIVSREICNLGENSGPSNKEIHKETMGNFDCLPGKFGIFPALCINCLLTKQNAGFTHDFSNYNIWIDWFIDWQNHWLTTDLEITWLPT